MTFTPSTPGELTVRLFLLLIISFASSAQQEIATIPVTVKPLSDVLIERRLSANAEVMALNDSLLSAEISAVVSALHVDVGDVVKKGDLLLSMDTIDANLELDQAKANTQAAKARLAQAELRLNRAKELEQSQYISADDLLARETDVAVLRADLLRFKVAEKSAARKTEKTQIKAPFDGIITARQAQQGQLLVMGAGMFQLAQSTGAEIHAKIPSHLANQLAQADRTLFMSKDHEIAVELIQLSSVIEQQTGMQMARLKPQAEIKIGQTGQLVWFLKGQLLSADLVVKRQGKLGVFIANNGQAQFMPLDGAQEGRPVAMQETPDWDVIIGGRERLQNGQAITVK